MPPQGPGASEAALLTRLGKFAGPSDSFVRPEPSQEEAKRQILESIASAGGAEGAEDPEERARHQRFLEAQEQARQRSRRAPRQKTTVRLEDDRYDAEVVERLEELGRAGTGGGPEGAEGGPEAARERHEQFLRAKEAGFQQVRQEKAAAQAQQAKLVSTSATQAQAADQAQTKQSGVKYSTSDWITPEMYKEYGYPEHDKRFADKNWHRQQMELDATDPRHNPNLLLDSNDPEFWYTASRKPFVKAMLRSEQHWERRKKAWQRQYVQVQMGNGRRRALAEELEETASREVKRILAPILRYSICTTILENMLGRARAQGKSLGELLAEAESQEALRRLRSKIEAGGEDEASQGAAAAALMEEYEGRWRNMAECKIADHQRGLRAERVVADVQILADVLNWGLKCKKDGLIEWEKGNWAEAHAAWFQADEALRRFRAADQDPANKQVYELHGTILKNLAQACIKLGYWSDGVVAADAAIQLDPDDHKAWFRRACACEGLGLLEEAEEALRRVDDCSVGRVDRVRIARDTRARREKLEVLRSRGLESSRQMIGKALGSSVFSAGRGSQPLEEEGPPDGRPSPEGAAPAALAASSPSVASVVTTAGSEVAVARKRLTREGAEDLLEALRDAYRDTTFQLQTAKLARDVRRDREEFLANLKKLALPLQRPILEKWGFEPTERGVQEMKWAVQDFTAGERLEPEVKRRADEVTVLYLGCMYEELTRPDSEEPPQQPEGPRFEARLNGAGLGAEGEESD